MASELTQSRVAATWGDVYTGAALQVPWYVVGGYADWAGNATAERALTEGATSRWQYPSLWHSVNVLVPPDYATLEIIMLDTVTLAGAMFNDPGAHNIPAGLAPTAAPGPPPPLGSFAGTGVGGGGGAATAAAAVPGVGSAATARQAAAAQAASAAQAAEAAAQAAQAAAAAAEAAAAAAPAPAAAAARPAAGGRRRLRDFNGAVNPPISQIQWGWVGTMLNQSTADWIIVVGNDPLWSAGAHGPTWALTDTLLPMLSAAGVSLYIGGRDPVPQHFAPSASYPGVDAIVIGNGAGGNATQASTLPSAALCPKGTLNWYDTSGTGGFLTVSMAQSATNAAEGLMTVTFYDETGAIQHSFTKPNPRKGGKNDPPASGYGTSAAANARAEGGMVGLAGLVLLGVLVAVANNWSELKGGGGEGEGGKKAPGALRWGASAAAPGGAGAAPQPVARVRSAAAPPTQQQAAEGGMARVRSAAAPQRAERAPLLPRTPQVGSQL